MPDCSTAFLVRPLPMANSDLAPISPMPLIAPIAPISTAEASEVGQLQRVAPLAEKGDV
jgi:hypothetical protein